MKNTVIWLIMIVLAISGCKSSKHASVARNEGIELMSSASEDNPDEIDYHQQSTWLLGYFERIQLTRMPHSAWFMKGYDAYIPETNIMNQLLDIGSENLTIKVVLGTWCPDSRREVPRFMRVMDLWNFPADKITFIGVDDAKLSPLGEYPGLDIERVPTFIIYRKNIEAGRIIENPATSLEQDIVNILNRNE